MTGAEPMFRLVGEEQMSTTTAVIICPECGSRNVRWRRSRPTDAVLNYLRFITDRAFGGLDMVAITNVRTFRGGPGFAGDAPYAVDSAIRDHEAREFFEVEAGSKTPSAFWRCLDCRKKGEVYDDIEKTLGLAGEMGAEESYLEESGGSVHKPVGGQGQSE